MDLQYYPNVGSSDLIGPIICPLLLFQPIFCSVMSPLKHSYSGFGTNSQISFCSQNSNFWLALESYLVASGRQVCSLMPTGPADFATTSAVHLLRLPNRSHLHTGVPPNFHHLL